MLLRLVSPRRNRSDQPPDQFAAAFTGWIRCCRRLVRKELQSLSTDDNIELLSLAERQAAGVAFAPVDARRYRTRNGEHFRTEIDADEVSGTAKPLFGDARYYSCSASDIEHAIASSA